MSLREEDIEKVEKQPLVWDPTFIDPSTDPDTGIAKATGFVMTVWCDRPPVDGDQASYVAATNRFELRSGAALGEPQPMLIQDETTGAWGFLTDGDGNPIYGYPE
jgi:hypothetical protein